MSGASAQSTSATFEFFLKRCERFSAPLEPALPGKERVKARGVTAPGTTQTANLSAATRTRAPILIHRDLGLIAILVCELAEFFVFADNVGITSTGEMHGAGPADGFRDPTKKRRHRPSVHARTVVVVKAKPNGGNAAGAEPPQPP